MQDFFKDLYDDDRKKDDDQEPSFSLYDFKKWLSKQKDTEADITEGRKHKEKEDLKEKFKERIKQKMEKRKKKED